MKKLKLIYNPSSGNKSFKYDIDTCLEKFQNAGYFTDIFRLEKNNLIEKYIENIKNEKIDAFVVCGGDGSVNLLINVLMKNNLNHIPIGIIPCGTANDFASFLKLPKKTSDICDIICKGKTINVDIGLVNDKYFINVCAGGLFTNMNENLNKNFKEIFGKFAYYIKAVEQLNNFNPISLKIVNSKTIIKDEFNLFLILNSSGTGGIEKISQTASINDGLFDFIAFKNIGFSEVPILLKKFLKHDYLNHEKVVFFKDNYVKIENMSDKEIFSDLDGERGPKLPIIVKNINNAIKIFC